MSIKLIRINGQGCGCQLKNEFHFLDKFSSLVFGIIMLGNWGFPITWNVGMNNKLRVTGYELRVKGCE
jgi:hypothetical protein